LDTTIIGIDCAVQDGNVGLAVGHFDGHQAWLRDALQGSPQHIARRVCDWIAGSAPTLIALDAPLGWPSAFGQTLAVHQAGAPIQVEPDLMFRRLTDRVVRQEIGKQSLDVGADRIARTAHAALKLLQDLRQETGKPIPLAWKPALEAEVCAIEVYPAATLKVHQIAVPGYKDKDGQAQRRLLLGQLGQLIRLPDDLDAMVKSDDALDAAICVLAGADFLRGPVIEPTDVATAEKEGWIWVRRPIDET
jgi:predicted RNase H-like nuclease